MHAQEKMQAQKRARKTLNLYIRQTFDTETAYNNNVPNLPPRKTTKNPPSPK